MPKSFSVTDLEREILNILWAEGQVTIRYLTDQIYDEPLDSNYATIQKTLDRMAAKELVTRKRIGRAHSFSATISRDEFIKANLQTLAENVCEGSLTPLISSMVNAKGLKKRDLEKLRDMINARLKKRK